MLGSLVNAFWITKKSRRQWIHRVIVHAALYIQIERGGLKMYFNL